MHLSKSLMDDCTALLSPGGPVDAMPARVPLALYSALAQRVQRKRLSSVVVVGDGSTDGLTCLSRLAAHRASAALVGGDVPHECAHFRNRGVVVDCAATVLVNNGTLANGSLPAANLYVWSQQAWRHAKWRDWMHRVGSERCRRHFGYCDPDYPESWRPHLGSAKINFVDSFDVLHVLRSRQLEGAVPRSAEFALLLDARGEHDEWTYRRLRDLGWIDWSEAFVGVAQREHALCENYTGSLTKGGTSLSKHVCTYHAEEQRFWLLGGRVRNVPRASVELANACTRRHEPIVEGFGALEAKEEVRQIRAGHGVRRITGLTAAIMTNGTTRCDQAADALLEAHVAAAALSPTSPLRDGGLFTVFAHRQVASEHAASAYILGLSSAHWLLRRSSLLLVCTNVALPTASLLRWLGWHTWPRRGLRLLVHAANRLGAQGYSCGELYSLSALVRVWARFPFVVCLSGPDVLPLPAEIELLGTRMAHVEHVRLEHNAARGRTGSGGGDDAGGGYAFGGRATTALLYDHFRTSKNDPLSYVEERYNMDLFVFFSARWLVRRSDGGADEPDSLWARAAAICVNKTRNRPEAVLHMVQREANLTVELLGNGSRGSLIDVHKYTFTSPSGKVWHSHNMPAVVRWLQSAAAPPNAYQETSNASTEGI